MAAEERGERGREGGSEVGQNGEEEMSLLTWKFFCGETGGGRDGTCFCQIIPSCLRRVRRRRQIVMSGSHVIPRLFSSVFFAGKIHTIRGGGGDGKCRAVNAAAAAAVRILTQDAANFGAVAERPLTR